MILLSTAIKVISIFGLIALSGGAGYYYYSTHSQDNQVKKEKLVDINQHVDHHFSNRLREFTHEHEFHHNCAHGEFIRKYPLEQIEQMESPIEATLNHEQMLIKNHKQGNWQNIRILADYSNLKVTPQQLDFIKNKLIRASVGFLKAALQVYPAQQIKLGSSCSSYSVPNNLQLTTENDLILFIGATQSSENWLAQAGSCAQDPTTLRPVAGAVSINLTYLNKLNLNEPDDKAQQDWVDTIIHETIHVLGFSSGLWSSYIDPVTNKKLGRANVVTSSQGRDWIITPKVMEKIEAHFGCAVATGAPLENDGGAGTAGSHWERTTFGNEAMTGSSFPDSVFTVFTFALLESTGWYNPDYSQAEPFNWGEQEGCAIVQGQCPTNLSEFCTSGAKGCSSDAMGIASCTSSDPLATGCSYWKGYQNTDCRKVSSQTSMITQYTGGFAGIGSRCFLSSLPQKAGLTTIYSGCWQNRCVNNTIEITISDKTFTCSSTGQQISVQYKGYSGTITCPDIYRFCRTVRACPNDCSGQGTCRGTICNCWSGYTGLDCSQQV